MEKPEKVDVLINALGKPCQTTLTLLTLLRHSGRYLGTIYFNEESATPPGEARKYEFLKERLGARLVVHKPAYCHWIRTVDRARYVEDDIRLSVRYQYGWERSDKRLVLVLHNDCEFFGDVVGPMIQALGDRIAIGHLGACQGCPAFHAGVCDSTRHLDYRPSHAELYALYAAHAAAGSQYCAPFHLTDFNEKYRQEPWPLPPCRVNEWCCLVNLAKARPVTAPFGPAVPFGAITDCGDYGLDTAAEWFHDVHRLGFTAGHFHLYDAMRHIGGHAAMSDPALYRRREEEAAARLANDFGVTL
ncbi:hypothetical protein [Desulfovibrio sp. DV]|uniref:hypothetical protein n=1 Tax=Desulfovibrio sp. DV TaxID=1844708 RepID=UPI00094BAADD|nr:hypothetical protein [Desulfovibrio sp. DV]